MPPGDTPAKLTRDAKAMIQLAFEDLGGLPRLVQWANEPSNLGTFYTQIWGKIIPKDIKAEVDQSITIEVVKFGDEGQYALQHNGNQIVMNAVNRTSDLITDAITQECDEEEYC
jgi:hypothetical protein